MSSTKQNKSRREHNTIGQIEQESTEQKRAVEQNRTGAQNKTKQKKRIQTKHKTKMEWNQVI